MSRTWTLIGAAALALAVSGCTKQAQVKPDTVTVAPPKPLMTTAPASVAEAPDVQKDRAALEALLDKSRVFFEFNSSTLSSEGEGVLQQVGTILRKQPSIAVRIEGNCDERGTEEYNLQLGQQRAEKARAYLVALGVPDQQIETISYGKLRPLDPGHSEQAWARNRRDDVKVTRD